MPHAFACIPCAALALFSFAAAAQQSFQSRYYPFDNLDPAVQVDLNNDGIPDFIAETRNLQVQELLSSGAGNYTSKTLTVTGSNGGYPIVSGDFNGDGIADVVFWNPYGIAYGDGSGGFSSFKSIPWSGTSGYARAVVADCNHDGAPDVIVAYANSSQFQVVEFLNDGSGPITPKVIYTQTIPSGSTPGFEYTTALDLVLGDFDADGNLDFFLRTTESDPSNPAQPIVTLTALYGNGGGFFTPKTVEVSHSAIYEIASARLNGDGTSDIVANNFSGGTTAPMRIYYGQTNRTFNAVNQAAANDRAINPMLADFNGDQRKDIIYPAQTSAAQDNIGISELLRASSGSYTQQPFYPNDTYNAQAGVVPFSQTFVGDYNHDGRPDVAMISSANQVGHPNSLVIMLNGGVPPNGTCMTPSGVGIAVCSPAPGATVSRPFNVTFSANYLYPLRDTQVWIDGVKKSEQYEAFDTQAFHSASFFPSTGKHTIGLFAVTYDGKMLLHKSYTVTVK